MTTPKKDVLHIAAIPGLEPEEQPVTREAEVAVAVRGNRTGEILGHMNSATHITKTASEVAGEFRRLCGNCQHFDQRKALELFAQKTQTKDGQIELMRLHAQLIASDNLSAEAAGFLPTLADLAPLGYCHAVSADRTAKTGGQVDMIVHPLGGCATRDYGDFFKPIDRAAARRGDKAYDHIMQKAEGKNL